MGVAGLVCSMLLSSNHAFCTHTHTQRALGAVPELGGADGALPFELKPYSPVALRARFFWQLSNVHRPRNCVCFRNTLHQPCQCVV